MKNEKLAILEMIQENKVTAAEGMELLRALESEPAGDRGGAASANRFLKVRVEGDKTPKVNVNIPMNLVKSVTRLANLALAFIPAEAKKEIDKKGINLPHLIDELFQGLEQGLSGDKMVDIDVNDPHEGRVKVEIFAE